jgi:hypothetical protein
MPVWLSRLMQDWRILASDPGSMATGVIIAAGIAAGFLYWSYASLVSWSPLSQTASELAELQAGYKALHQPSLEPRPPRDPRGLYRNGQRIGVVVEPDINVPSGAVAFQKISIDGELDRATSLEFQDLIITYKGCDVSDGIRRGDEATFTYYNARFSIVGKRVD